MTFSLNFKERDCKMNAGDMREILSSEFATGAKTLGRRVVISMVSFPHHTCAPFPVSVVVHFFQHLFS